MKIRITDKIEYRIQNTSLGCKKKKKKKKKNKNINLGYRIQNKDTELKIQGIRVRI